MAELESAIEQKLIEQLVYGDSQWTYRGDLKTEADLWKNFRYILEQNNKDRLDGEALSDAESELETDCDSDNDSLSAFTADSSGAGPGAFSYGFKDPYSTGPSGKFDYPDTRHDHCRDEGWRIPDSLL